MRKKKKKKKKKEKKEKKRKKKKVEKKRASTEVKIKMKNNYENYVEVKVTKRNNKAQKEVKSTFRGATRTQ